MAKIKDTLSANISGIWNFRNGSIDDQRGAGPDGTFGGTPYWSNTTKGRSLVFDGATDYVDIGNQGDSIKSITCVLRADDITSNTDYVIDLNGTDYITIVNGTVTVNGFAAATTVIYVNGLVSSILANTEDIYHITITSDTGFTASDLDIGRLEGTGFFGGAMLEVIVWDAQLTPQQSSELYVDFTQEANLTHIPETSVLPSLAAFPGFEEDSIWTKGTGWTIANGKASSDGSQSADSDLTQNIGVVGTSYTIEYKISGYSAGNVTALAGSAEGTDRAADGIFTEAVVAAGTGLIGLRADLDFVGDIDYIKIGEGNRLDFYSTGQDWNVSTATETSGFLSNTGWKIGAGAFQAGESAGVKALAGLSAPNILYKESVGAYGTWNFALNKRQEANLSYIQFMANGTVGTITTSGNTGYAVYIGSDERIHLVTMDSGSSADLFKTAASYVTVNTGYKFGVTRSAAGVFNVYIIGGAFTVWTLIVIDGDGTGSNPVTDTTYTTSDRITLDVDAFDAVTGVQHHPTVITPTT